MKFTHDDVNLQSCTSLYKGWLSIEQRVIEHALFAGGTVEGVRRELVVRGDAVGVLPYDPIRDEVILIEQFRVGVVKSQHSPWMLEIVAGLVEPGEQYRDVAEREMVEECGQTVRVLEPIGGYYSSPGFTDEYLYLFAGLVNSEGVAGQIHGLAEEHEDIRVHVLSAEQAFAKLDAGEIINASTLIALQWLRIHQRRIRQMWLDK